MGSTVGFVLFLLVAVLSSVSAINMTDLADMDMDLMNHLMNGTEAKTMNTLRELEAIIMDKETMKTLGCKNEIRNGKSTKNMKVKQIRKLMKNLRRNVAHQSAMLQLFTRTPNNVPTNTGTDHAPSCGKQYETIKRDNERLYKRETSLTISIEECNKNRRNLRKRENECLSKLSSLQSDVEGRSSESSCSEELTRSREEMHELRSSLHFCQTMASDLQTEIKNLITQNNSTEEAVEL